eukprot:9128465-Pyramimonas_sp.AAC.1
MCGVMIVSRLGEDRSHTNDASSLKAYFRGFVSQRPRAMRPTGEPNRLATDRPGCITGTTRVHHWRGIN